MNITYLIGNGFDINLGLKTSYHDFYEYYKEQPSNSEKITKFKNEIADNIALWSDLEEKFGEYCKNFKTFDEFDEVFADLYEKLETYIKEIDDNLIIDDTHSDMYLDYLRHPETFLLPEEIGKIRQALGSVEQLFINIHTFNYTSCLKHILGSLENTRITIKHIHGIINNTVIFGLNDLTQVDNEALRLDDDFANHLIKPTVNKEMKRGVNVKCINDLRQSSVICTFGLSFGNTDKMWWESIGNLLLNSTVTQYLIIFEKGEIFEGSTSKFKYLSKSKKIKDKFLSKTKLNYSQKARVKEQIFVAYNTGMFKPKQK